MVLTLKTLDTTTITTKTKQNKTKQELFLLLTPILLYPETICEPCSVIVFLLALDRFMCFCSTQPKALQLPPPHYNIIQSWLSNGELNLAEKSPYVG
jgi:hypothetical protein